MKLTPPAREDIPVLEKWLSDEPLLRLIAVEPPRPDRPTLVCMIRLDDGTPVGWIELFNIDPENRKAELGIAVPEPQGRGLAPLAAKKFLTLAFEVWGLNRVTARMLATNTYAIRCAELFGFVREGTERQAVWRDGRFEDVVRFGMLREEFLRRKRVTRHGGSSTIRKRGAGDSDRPQEPIDPRDTEDARGPADALLGRGHAPGDRDVDAHLRRTAPEDASGR